MDTKNHWESFVDRSLQVNADGISINLEEVKEVQKRVERGASGNQPTLTEWEVRRLYGALALVGSERKVMGSRLEKLDLALGLYQPSMPSADPGLKGLTVEKIVAKSAEVKSVDRELEKLYGEFNRIVSVESDFPGREALKDPREWRFKRPELDRLATNNEKNRDVNVLLHLSDWESRFNTYGPKEQQFKGERELMGRISGRAITANILFFEAQRLFSEVERKANEGAPVPPELRQFAEANLRTAKDYDGAANGILDREVSKLNGRSKELSFIQKPWGGSNMGETIPTPFLTREQRSVIETFARSDSSQPRGGRYLEAVGRSQVDDSTYVNSRRVNEIGDRNVGGRGR